MTVKVPVVSVAGDEERVRGVEEPVVDLPFPVVSPASLSVAVTGEPPVGVKLSIEPGTGDCAPR